jgi:hypothetical protein
MIFILELFVFLAMIVCCIFFCSRASANEEESEDLQSLRTSMSERRQRNQHGVDVVDVVLLANRKKTIQNKLFFKTVKQGDSTRSMGNIMNSARDMYAANAIPSSSTRSSVSRSWRAAETSVRQFQKQECSVCLSGYEENETMCWAKTDKCSHVFHEDCICEWLKDHDECPLCREDIVNAEVTISDESNNTGPEEGEIADGEA